MTGGQRASARRDRHTHSTSDSSSVIVNLKEQSEFGSSLDSVKIFVSFTGLYPHLLLSIPTDSNTTKTTALLFFYFFFFIPCFKSAVSERALKS